MTKISKRMERHATHMRRVASTMPPFGGSDGSRDQEILTLGLTVYIDKPVSTRILFTRDEGMHTSGWWKNPDYERCFHLSLSFIDTESGMDAPHDRKLATAWCLLFFRESTRLLWVEPPYSAHGRQHDVWHYRLFVAEDWRTPILPRGEVYTREFTEAGWKSWSDVHPHLVLVR